MKKRSLLLWIGIPVVLIVLLLGALVVVAVFVIPGGSAKVSTGKEKGAGWSPFSFGESGKRVRTFEARRGSVVSTVSAPGIVTPAQEVAISSRLSGRILEIYADEGYEVKEGEVIAKLETKEIEIALERAQSDLQVAQARVDEATASLRQAEVAAKRSAAELERKESLHGKGAFSDSEMDRARTLADADQLRETQARKNVRETQEAARSTKLALEKVERDLDETDIRTPLTGVVTARNVNIGERVILGVAGDPSAALFVVSDLSKILVYADVVESDVSRLAPGQPVKITTEALKDTEFDGETIDVAPRARRTGEISTFRTRILVKGDTAKLRPGMSAQVEVEVERADDVVIVPIEAVVESDKDEKDDEEGKEGEEEERSRRKRQGKKEYIDVVFRVDDGVAKRQEVKAGISDNLHIVILDGVGPGDQVITGPYKALDDMKDGDAVKVTKSEKAEDEEEEGSGEDSKEKGTGGEKETASVETDPGQTGEEMPSSEADAEGPGDGERK